MVTNIYSGDRVATDATMATMNLYSTFNDTNTIFKSGGGAIVH